MPSRLFERESLLARLGAAHAAGGRLVLLGGDAGAGKTALVRQFLAATDARAFLGELRAGQITGDRVERSRCRVFAGRRWSRAV
jgi:MoxR-like ATPase